MSDEKNVPDDSVREQPAYAPPAVEEVMTAEDLARDIQYAGGLTDPN